MDKLANLFSRVTGQPAVNQTGLVGVFTFTLEWAPDETQRLGSSENGAASPIAGTSLLTAVQSSLA